MFFTCTNCDWTSATIIATRNHQLAIEHSIRFIHMVVDSEGYALHEDAKAHGISFGRRTA